MPSSKLIPDLALCCKLASIVVHTDELFSPDGRVVDKDALKTVIEDPEVKEWIRQMTKAGMAPVKRW